MYLADNLRYQKLIIVIIDTHPRSSTFIGKIWHIGVFPPTMSEILKSWIPT